MAFIHPFFRGLQRATPRPHTSRGIKRGLRSLGLGSLALGLGATGAIATPLSPQFTTLLDVPAAPQISQAFKPPRSGAPSATAGGASRAACVTASHITPLVPTVKIGKFNRSSFYSQTLSERPTLYWQINEAAAGKTAEFLVLGENDTKLIYEGEIRLPNQAGIVAVDLPTAIPALKSGEQYRWYLSVPCGRISANGRVDLTGWLERVTPSATLTRQLQAATPKRRAELLAEAGIWQDALMAIAQWRQRSPQSSEVQSSWNTLLASVGLSVDAQLPLLSMTETPSNTTATIQPVNPNTPSAVKP